MAHPLSSSLASGSPSLLTQARTAAQAINTFMEHWNDTLDPKFHSAVFPDQRVHHLHFHGATQHYGQPATFWLAEFTPQTGKEGISPILFCLTRDGVAHLASGDHFSSDQLYPEQKGH
ncbi:MAG TPA: hypothetical protein VFN23_03830 [Ktedonobacteraceae bacterium]|nr:hypothetical protein [Ktedonobacteraceae bacterium]